VLILTCDFGGTQQVLYGTLFASSPRFDSTGLDWTGLDVASNPVESRRCTVSVTTTVPVKHFLLDSAGPVTIAPRLRVVPYFRTELDLTKACNKSPATAKINFQFDSLGFIT